MTGRCVRALVTLAGLAASPAAWAQDSIAPPSAQGLPGDALDAYATIPSHQRTDFAVELTPVLSSWGHRFAIAPLLKSSRSANALTSNHLIETQVVSPRSVAGPFARSAYASWSSAGAGVNPSVNTGPTSNIAVSGLVGQQLALAFLEMGAGADSAFGTGDDEQNIIGATIGVPFRRPNRLLVSRVNLASNKLITSSSTTASFGLGGADASGSVAVLGDGFGVSSPSRLSAKDYFRFSIGSRDATRVNRVQQSGSNDVAASVRVFETTTSLSVPNIFGAGVSARPVLVGAAFNGNLAYESSAGSTSTTRAYLPAGAGSPRGGVSIIPATFAPLASGLNDSATGAVITRAPGESVSRSISIFNLKNDGAVSAQFTITIPQIAGQLVDSADGFDPSVFFADVARYEFTNVQSQAAFRGGAPIALSVLPTGDLLVAATIQWPSNGSSGSSVPQQEDNAVIVARVSATGGPTIWMIAAHTGDQAGSLSGRSKAILGDAGADGIPGTGDAGEGDGTIDATPIGRLALQSEITLGATAGPSISSPAMDAAGNLYFLACAKLNTVNGPAFHHVLVRANYHDGSAAYTLELLTTAGQVVQSSGAARPYQIAYLGLADGDSIDSGAIWSTSIMQSPIDGVHLGQVDSSSPTTLGLLSVRARIVYDVDQDGVFVDPESAGGSATSDQAYNVTLAIMPRIPAGDFNRDTVVNSQDFFDFVTAFFSGAPGADYNGTGTVNSQDLFDFITDFFNG